MIPLPASWSSHLVNDRALMEADVFNHAIGDISKFKWELFKTLHLPNLHVTKLINDSYVPIPINLNQYEFRLQTLKFKVYCFMPELFVAVKFFLPIWSQIVELAFIC